ncbi:MAG: UDP-N-acetylmuramoyl-L-alanine--D-glutamate ligase [Ferrovibrionaceae bacterium]
MIVPAGFENRDVVVFGLARSGIAAAKALIAGGARVHAWDDGAAGRERAVAAGLDLTDWRGLDLAGMAAVVLAPGVPLTHPQPHELVVAAKAAGVPVIGDIELFVGAIDPSRLIGITGTNGKSTTTALIGHVIKAAGLPVAVGGNIGTAVFDLPALPMRGAYVVELSSYQLDLTPSWTARVGVLSNITPDHLDRHGDMAHYAEVKSHIFHRVGTAVCGVDDDYCRAIAARLDGNLVSVSVGGTAQVSVRDGVLHDGPDVVLDLKLLPALPGAHNWQNAALAYAACRAFGLGRADIVAGLASFPGLAHRMERLAEIGGIVFINDSKATNADAAEKALVCYDDIYWIAGGRAKVGGIEQLKPHLSRVRRAFLIGEATEDFARTIGDAAPVTRCGTLAAAVPAAFAAARAEGIAGAVVMLSPACASFDQFSDFEARGDAFRHLVQALVDAHGGAA